MPGDTVDVMLIDDAALMRLTITNLITKEKRYRVIASCENGQVALDKLKTMKPDIIIVDIEMPVMDGLTFLKSARLRTRAKIVVLSSVAGAGSEKAAKARELGADAVIQKPSGSVSTDLAEKKGAVVMDTLKRLAA